MKPLEGTRKWKTGAAFRRTALLKIPDFVCENVFEVLAKLVAISGTLTPLGKLRLG